MIRPRPPSVEERIAALEQRVAALEARNEKPAEALREHVARRVAEGQRLRQAIGAILAAHAGPKQPTRKDVLRALRCSGFRLAHDREPSLSAIGWHVRAVLRAHVNVNSANVDARERR
jgi:hypothetical protein